MKKILLVLTLLSLLLPVMAQAVVVEDCGSAATLGILIPSGFCGGTFFGLFGGGAASKTTASGLIVEIISVLLFIVGLLAVLFIIIGGFRYVTASGNEEQAEAAKKTLLHAILGLVIVILSFAVVRIISEALIIGRA